MNTGNEDLKGKITFIAVVTLAFIAITTSTLILVLKDLKDRIDNVDHKIEKNYNMNRVDYQIKLNSDNSIQLISKDTIRKIDFFDLEEVIMQDNI